MTAPQRMRATVAVSDRSEHAEGPLWDSGGDRLLWVDQYRGLVRSARFSPRGAVDVVDVVSVGSPVGAIVPHAGGGWLLAAGDGLVRLGVGGGLDPLIEVLPSDGVRRRMNDGKVDPLGRFWFGSMAVDRTVGAGSLYRLDRGELRVAIEGTTISNGLAWTPSGEVLFYIDTPTRVVRRYLVGPDGELRDDGVAVAISEGAGNPDGMCIDSEGALWVALWGGSAVHRYSADGELLAIVEVDAPQVSSCAFGGADLSTLYITTSAEDYDSEQLERHPTAGAIFTVSPGVAGLPASAYRP